MLEAFVMDAIVSSPATTDGPDAAVTGASLRIPVAHIRPNPDQPLRDIDETSVAFSVAFIELRSSIWLTGLIQPVVVWRPPADDHYLLLAGERRWRAFRSLASHDPARFSAIPAVVWTDVRHGAAATATIIGLLENVVREGLRPGDRAAAVARLRQLTGWTLEQIGAQMGLTISRVSELATMGVHEPVVAALNAGTLTRETALPIVRTAKHDEQLTLALVGAAQTLEPAMVGSLITEVGATPASEPAVQRVQTALAVVQAGAAAVDTVRLRDTARRVLRPRVTSMPRDDYIDMLRCALRDAHRSSASPR